MTKGSVRSALLLRNSLALAATAGLSATAPAQATDAVVLDQRLLATDATPGAFLGFRVAMDGTTLIVGAFGDDDNGSSSGSAYIFDTTSGTETAKLVPSDGAEEDIFGTSVGIHGSTAVIGASSNDDNGTDSGSAYLFDTLSGTEITKLLPDDGAAGDRFGAAVGIRGNTVIVGASRDDESATDSGSAYLFDAGSGAQLAKLSASDGAEDDYFGSAVDTDGNLAIVGAYANDDNGPTSGSAYLFDVTSGTEIMKLLPNDGFANDRFGIAVAIYGAVAIVGAPGDDDGGSQSGSAYLFDTETGAQIAKLVAGEPLFLREFGETVDISGSIALIGANGGEAHLFDLVTQLEIARLEVRDPGPLGGSAFTPVAISGDTAALGTWRNGEGSSDAGAVYLFDHAPAVGFRNAGTNPASYTAGAAWIGKDLSLTVDLATTGHTQGLVFGFDSPFELALGGGQTLLCFDLLGSGGELINTGFLDGPLAEITLPIPNDQTLIDFQVCTQAVHAFGALPFALSNAQDLIFGGCPNEAPALQLLADDGGANDRLGYAVAVDGNTAIAGAQRDDDNGTNSGSAYLFDVLSGTQLAKLEPDDGAEEDRFGRSVAIDGAIAVVGAPRDDDNGIDSGSAYLFDTSTGTQLAKLLPADGELDDSFGDSVAVAGNVVVIGAPDLDNGSNFGGAYVFTTAGVELMKLMPTDASPGNSFGNAVAVSGTTALIGARRDDENGNQSGAAYLFDTTTGMQIAKLTPDDAEAGDHFGFAVAIAGNIAVVGAYRAENDEFQSGAAYLFDAGTGLQIAKLLPSVGAEQERFGISVAISGTTVLVGGQADAAYEFDAATGEQTDTIFRPCASIGTSGFGASVALDGPTTVIGARLSDENGTDSGAAYVYGPGLVPTALGGSNGGAAESPGLPVEGLLGRFGGGPERPPAPRLRRTRPAQMSRQP